MANKFQLRLLLSIFLLTMLSMCGFQRRLAAQDIVKSTTRLTPTTIEFSSGYSYRSKWNASILVTVTKMQFANLVIGANIIGPYDNYLKNEESKSNITLWGGSIGIGIKDWQNKWKGSRIEATLGCGNREKGDGNPPWNYGFRSTVEHSIYTDRKGSYAVSIGYQYRIVYVVDNNDKNGVAYVSKQRLTPIHSINLSVFF